MKGAALAGLAAVLVLSGASTRVEARSDADAALALACSTCHAASPASSGIPPLRGPAARVLADLRAFRDGTRAATIMGRITRGYSDDELVRIAELIADEPANLTGAAR